MEPARRGRQPRRAATRARAARPPRRPGLHRPALQHRQRLRLPRPLPRPPGVAGDDAPAARRSAGGARRDRGDLREHRRQRGGVPAAAHGRGVRRGQLPRPGGREPQPQGTPAREGVRHQPRVPAGLRPRRPPYRARRVDDRDRRSCRLPPREPGRPAVPAPAVAQHQQEVQPGHRPDPALHGVGRPRVRSRRDRTLRRRGRDRTGVRGRQPGGVAMEPAAHRPASRRPGLSAGEGSRGGAGRRVPEGLAAPGRRGGRARRTTQEAAHDLARRGGRLHRHGGRRAQGRRRARLRVAQADRPGAPDPRHDARRRGRARLLRRQRHHGPRGRAAERRRRRHPTLPEHQLAEATREGSNARNAGLLTVADITRARLRAVAETVGGGFEELSV